MSSLESLDAQVSSLLSDWSITTTVLAVLIAAVLIYPLLYPSEPDTHPLLLARQSSASPVRNKGESAVYRSPEVPHGYPLRTGLNVKDPGAPRWSPGKDGDLRDVWREVQRGGSPSGDGKEVPSGLIMSVFGKEEVVEHDVAELSKEINVIGKHLKKSGAKKVAIYLPNSVEYLQTLFGESDGILRQRHLLTLDSLCVLRSRADSASFQPAARETLRSTEDYWSRRIGLSSWNRASGGLGKGDQKLEDTCLGGREDKQTYGLEWTTRRRKPLGRCMA